MQGCREQNSLAQGRPPSSDQPLDVWLPAARPPQAPGLSFSRFMNKVARSSCTGTFPFLLVSVGSAGTQAAGRRPSLNPWEVQVTAPPSPAPLCKVEQTNERVNERASQGLVLRALHLGVKDALL